MEDDLQDSSVRRAVDPDAYYHKDPKKALRNYLESKGYAYEFEVEEEGPGHAREYTARIRLPIDTAMGPVYGQATTGKKRDAEREAALDACIQLDKRGMLGQKAAVSEGKPHFNSKEYLYLNGMSPRQDRLRYLALSLRINTIAQKVRPI